MQSRGIDLANLFQSVTGTLSQNRATLNEADTQNHDHGDNMVDTFEVITRAMKEKKGADPAVGDKENLTALMVAAIHGKTEVAKAILDRGADINAADKNGMTALMWAARNGRKEVVQVLLEKGADLKARDKQGKSALDLAQYYRQNHTKEMLLKAGAGE